MEKLPRAVEEEMQQVCARLGGRPKLARMFRQCYPNTLATTTELLADGTTYVFTGDIPAMWLRDSTAQVRPYVALAARDADVQHIVEGLIRRQIRYIGIQPYANSFNREANGQHYAADTPDPGPWVWECKYEVDSLCYPLQLAYLYWRTTGRSGIFDQEFRQVAGRIVALWRAEQRHGVASPYRFQRHNCPPSDTLSHDGLGAPVALTGMTWSGFRPSDDACQYGYLVAANMFAVVALGYLAEIAAEVYRDADLATEATGLRDEIDRGIQDFGTVEHAEFGTIYAYETDGDGNYNLMDDANVPSLLAIPYLGYAAADDPVYRNTRRFVLSPHNRYYTVGKHARGIGSPHSPSGYVWPIGLAMQGLTATDAAERDELIDMLERTDADTGFMHESFDPDDPAQFTRSWFAWANSLFAEFVMSWSAERD